MVGMVERFEMVAAAEKVGIVAGEGAEGVAGAGKVDEIVAGRAGKAGRVVAGHEQGQS